MNIAIKNSLTTSTALPKRSSFEKVYRWIHKHPTVMKVMQVSGLILGVGLIIAAAGAASLLGMALIGFAIPGAMIAVVSTVALLSLDIFVPPHYDMKHHMFKPGECEGGRLYYEGDIPILSLESDDSFKAGKAHGYLCGEAINSLFKRFGFMLKIFGRQPCSKHLSHTIENLRKVIPEDYLKEIDGLVEGYGQWAKENARKLPKKLTAEDVLLFQLMPEYLHFKTKDFKNICKKAGKKVFACSAVVDKDPIRGFVFGRNVDWPSFNRGGRLSLIIHRKASKGRFGTVGIGAPSLIGQVTGMNDQGLALAMNVCSGKTLRIRGMPAVFYNQACLDKCRTVQEVEAFTQKESPLGPYHLTTADKTGQAKSFHFYQKDENSHYVREWKENEPLVTLNYRYSPSQPPYAPRHYSAQREQYIDHFFKNRKNLPFEKMLSLPFVNNFITTQSVIMELETGGIEVVFNDAYAASAPHKKVFVKGFRVEPSC